MTRSVIGLFNRQDQARSALEHLRIAGIPADAIGYLLPKSDGRVDSHEQLDMHALAARDQQVTDAGSPMGGGAGDQLVATGTLVIPEVGPFSTGGTLAMLVGGPAGWLVGRLSALKLPGEDGRYVEAQVQSGRSLVTVNTDRRSAVVRQIFVDHGGEALPAQKIVQGAGEAVQDVEDSMLVRTDLWSPRSAARSMDSGSRTKLWESSRVDPRGAVERGPAEPYHEPQHGGARTEPDRLLSDPRKVLDADQP